MAADADSNAGQAPVAATERIAALDVLRGFSLLGIFIMNMPSFSHSPFAAPAPARNGLDALVAALRDTFFAGKFNLLFGLVFGIGFALQMARLGDAEAARGQRLGAAPRRQRAARIYLRRLAFLFGVGLVHAMLLWSGDVLLIYAVLGFVLLALRGCDERVLIALIAACLLVPALAEVLRPALLADGEAVAAFQYQQLEASNDLAYGAGSFLDALRETARVFNWSLRSPLGLFSYALFVVQMATGVLAGVVVGRRGWPQRPTMKAKAARQAPWTALLVAIACGLIAPIAFVVMGGSGGVFVETLAITVGRAALAACYAMAVVRLVAGDHDLPRWLRPLRDAGSMPLTNYLLQTVLASFVCYGWGLGLWNSAGPALETALALALFVCVQLPLSSAWLARFRHGPIETVWRRFTYAEAR